MSADAEAAAATRVRPRGDLRELSGYHSPQLDVAVRLNTNESPYPPPREFVDAWRAALADVPLHRYPDRAATDLRRALGAHLDQPAARLLCANGSNEVLQTLLLTYGGAGRRALVFEPTYALHAHIARITATEVVEAERDADFAIDVDAAARVVADADPTVVFVCSPNNPTGTVEPPATITSLARVAREHGALLVVDEAYGEFADTSAVDLVDDDLPLVVVRTFSKVWSMAALRLGFAVGPAWVVEELEKVVLPYSLAGPTQLAGVLALEYDTAMRDRVAALVAERTRLVAALAERPGVRVFPSGANFVLLRVSDAQGVWEGLVARGVLVRNFAHWPRVESCLRVTVGTRAEDDVFLAALDDILEEAAT